MKIVFASSLVYIFYILLEIIVNKLNGTTPMLLTTSRVKCNVALPRRLWICGWMDRLSWKVSGVSIDEFCALISIYKRGKQKKYYLHCNPLRLCLLCCYFILFLYQLLKLNRTCIVDNDWLKSLYSIILEHNNYCKNSKVSNRNFKESYEHWK